MRVSERVSEGNFGNEKLSLSGATLEADPKPVDISGNIWH